MTYRVVGSDVVVSERETQKCSFCPRRGKCGSCLGSGRILLNDGLHWPVAVEVVGATPHVVRSS